MNLIDTKHAPILLTERHSMVAPKLTSMSTAAQKLSCAH